MSKPKIGFIGLGLMGRAIVGRLQDKGYELTVLGNRDRTGVEAAVARHSGVRGLHILAALGGREQAAREADAVWSGSHRCPHLRRCGSAKEP